MELTHKKTYSNNGIVEQFFVNDKKVDRWTYDMLDDDAFDKLKNTNVKSDKPKIVVKQPQPKQKPVSKKIAMPEEFEEVLEGIIEYIKISSKADGMERIIETLDYVSGETYVYGYTDALMHIKDDVADAIIKLTRRSRGGTHNE